MSAPKPRRPRRTDCRDRIAFSAGSLDPFLEAVLKKQTPAFGGGVDVSQTTESGIGHLQEGGGFSPRRKRNVEKRRGRSPERRRDESRHRDRVRRIESDDVIPNEPVTFPGIFVESSAWFHLEDDASRRFRRIEIFRPPGMDVARKRFPHGEVWFCNFQTETVSRGCDRRCRWFFRHTLRRGALSPRGAPWKAQRGSIAAASFLDSCEKQMA